MKPSAWCGKPTLTGCPSKIEPRVAASSRDPQTPPPSQERRFLPLWLDDISIKDDAVQWPSSFTGGFGAWHCAEIYMTA